MRAFSVAAMLVALLAGVFGSALAADWTEIDASQLKQMMERDGALAIFPLSQIEFNNLHIPGSVHISLGDLEAKLPKNKNAPLAFYCLGRT